MPKDDEEPRLQVQEDIICQSRRDAVIVTGQSSQDRTLSSKAHWAYIEKSLYVDYVKRSSNSVIVSYSEVKLWLKDRSPPYGKVTSQKEAVI